jgi:hypothetical protein
MTSRNPMVRVTLVALVPESALVDFFAAAQQGARNFGGHIIDEGDVETDTRALSGLPTGLRRILGALEEPIYEPRHLVAYSARDLRKIPGIGPGYVKRIEAFMADQGLLLQGSRTHNPKNVLARLMVSQRIYQALRSVRIYTLSALTELDEIDLFGLGIGENAIEDVRIALRLLDPPLSLADKRSERTLSDLPLSAQDFGLLLGVGFDLEEPLGHLTQSALKRDYSQLGAEIGQGLAELLPQIVFMMSLIGLEPDAW